MQRILSLLCGAALIQMPAAAQQVSCPRPRSGVMVFADGAIAMRTALAVNPDGTAASYTPGDHGYTYIANGVNLRDGERWIICRDHSVHCRDAWFRAEIGAFGRGTPEFCSYAIEAEPIRAGAPLVQCQERGRSVIGNGKGRPRAGAPVPAATGGTVTPYRSMTALTHRVRGERRYIDSALVPSLVAPRDRADLIGAVAWVRYRGRSSFAIVGDIGPSFGEGSVALHMRLRGREIGEAQPVGPIPRIARCTTVETRLRPPFESRPDIRGDECGTGQPVRGGTDIRAYAGIGDGVDSIILPRVRPPMDGRIASEELSETYLRDLADRAAYSAAELSTMADCLSR